MKAGDTVYRYIADAEWFEDNVKLENVFDFGIVVCHSDGVGVVPQDADFCGKDYPSTVSIDRVDAYQPTMIDSLRKALKFNEDYARLLDLERQWISEQIKKLESQ